MVSFSRGNSPGSRSHHPKQKNVPVFPEFKHVTCFLLALSLSSTASSKGWDEKLVKMVQEKEKSRPPVPALKVRISFLNPKCYLLIMFLNINTINGPGLFSLNPYKQLWTWVQTEWKWFEGCTGVSTTCHHQVRCSTAGAQQRPGPLDTGTNTLAWKTTSGSNQRQRDVVLLPESHPGFCSLCHSTSHLFQMFWSLGWK